MKSTREFIGGMAIAAGICALFGLFIYGAKGLADAERRSGDYRAAALGRVFVVNGHTYTSIRGTFGMGVECVSATGPALTLSYSAVHNLADLPGVEARP